MKHTNIFYAIGLNIFLFISLYTIGCTKNSPLSTLFNPPKCEIINIEKTNSTYNHPIIIVTVKNTGDESTAYSVSCYIKLKNGNEIVTQKSLYFGKLEFSEYISDETRLDVKTHDDYNFEEYTLIWYDAQNRKYSHVY